uniref:Calponin-homology (CH) domain-containing protein n=1 Tax=Romanomermis culicivorax TaxID=13658 RepID=A0A915JQ60_ROMCU
MANCGCTCCMRSLSKRRHEQEKVQKRTFTKWANFHLRKHEPPSEIDDLYEDVRDGIRLCYLLEVLSGEKLQINQGRRLTRLHHENNIRTALKFIESRGIRLVNNNASDIADGKPSIVLGLIWQIILHFQIEENVQLLHSLGLYSAGSSAASSTSSLDSVGLLNVKNSTTAQSTPIVVNATTPMKIQMSSAGSVMTPTLTPPAVPHKRLKLPSLSPRLSSSPMKQKWKQGAKKALLQWVKSVITEKYGFTVKDFGSSWRDGLLFNALIHRVRPDLIDIDQLKASPASNREKLALAFDMAEKYLGVAKILDPIDVDVENADEKSIITYVAQFLHKYPSPTVALEAKPSTSHKLFVETSVSRYENLSRWLDRVALEFETLSTNVEIVDRYLKCLRIRADYAQYADLYLSLSSERCQNGNNALSVRYKYSVEYYDWLRLVEKWRHVTEQLFRIEGPYLALENCDSYLKRVIALPIDFLPVSDQENFEESSVDISKRIESLEKFNSEYEASKSIFESIVADPSSTLPNDIVDLLRHEYKNLPKIKEYRHLTLKYLGSKFESLLPFFSLSARLLYLETKVDKFASPINSQSMLLDICSEIRASMQILKLQRSPSNPVIEKFGYGDTGNQLDNDGSKVSLLKYEHDYLTEITFNEKENHEWAQ